MVVHDLLLNLGRKSDLYAYILAVGSRLIMLTRRFRPSPLESTTSGVGNKPFA
jgi:hypothetical protein